MSDKPVNHDTFTIERVYDASAARVFAAWADPVRKRRWFVDVEGFTADSYELDFREGGLERTRFRHGDGPPMTNDAYFHDIVTDRRIVCSYAMTMGGKRFSVSLATLELEPRGKSTLLRYTEQAAFFDGLDHLESRRGGCVELFERLAAELGSEVVR